jgi:hypothetical protein
MAAAAAWFFVRTARPRHALLCGRIPERRRPFDFDQGVCCKFALHVAEIGHAI